MKSRMNEIKDGWIQELRMTMMDVVKDKAKSRIRTKKIHGMEHKYLFLKIYEVEQK